METKILTSNEEDLKLAGNIIKAGGTVIFPTETVYGLGANALDANAVKKIFKAKGRPSDNPLIVHIADISQIYDFVIDVPENAKKLADAYWPGPMTLVLNKKDIIPNEVSAGLNTVGIRIPESEVAREFIKKAGCPIAAPSANLSGSPSPTTVEHVVADMFGKVDAIIKGENSRVGLESTVIDATGKMPIILRPGGITPKMVKEICGNVIIAKGIDGVTDELKPKSPGMKYKHYAPNCEIILIKNDENLIENVKNEADKYSKKETVIICAEQNQEFYKEYNTLCIGNIDNLETIATNLFAVFRKCDEIGYKFAIMEAVEEEGIGLAIMNRAKRAAKK